MMGKKQNAQRSHYEPSVRASGDVNEHNGGREGVSSRTRFGEFKPSNPIELISFHFLPHRFDLLLPVFIRSQKRSVSVGEKQHIKVWDPLGHFRGKL